MDVSTPSRMLKITCLIAILFNLGILLYFAAVASVWGDEANSFFLSSLPLSTMLDLMSHNFDEDAPAFNVLQHVWQKVVHDNPVLLRLLPFTFWIASLVGVGLHAVLAVGPQCTGR